MSRQATKAVGNRYYEARIRAAKYNKRLLTRVGAAEQLPGVTEDSIKKYELGITNPPNIVVALMADVYIEPELRCWYCANECPLGTYSREIAPTSAIRSFLRLQNSVYELESVTRQMSILMESEEISKEEKPQIPILMERILEFRRRADENLVALERAEKIGRFE